MKFNFDSIKKYKISDKIVLDPKDDPYISARIQKRIRIGVIIVHAVLLISPLIVAFWVWLFAEKEAEILAVSLVLPSEHDAPIDIKATKPAVKPAPKKQPKPKPKPKEKPKPVAKPKAKPTPVTKPKPVTKTKPSPVTPQKWERTTTSAIESSQQSERITNPPPAKKTGPVPMLGNPNATPSENAEYLAKLKAELDPEFAKIRPSVFDLGGATPENTVEISIDQYGNITSCRFIKRSGVPAMDEAVRKLFLIKRRVIKKEKGPFPFTTTVTFAVE